MNVYYILNEQRVVKVAVHHHMLIFRCAVVQNIHDIEREFYIGSPGGSSSAQYYNTLEAVKMNLIANKYRENPHKNTHDSIHTYSEE